MPALKLGKDQLKKEWSGRWDSNPRLDLGKVPYYPYTTTALDSKTLARQACHDKVLSVRERRQSVHTQPAQKSKSDAIIGSCVCYWALANLQHARCLDDRRFSLAFGKF